MTVKLTKNFQTNKITKNSHLFLVFQRLNFAKGRAYGAYQLHNRHQLTCMNMNIKTSIFLALSVCLSFWNTRWAGPKLPQPGSLKLGLGCVGLRGPQGLRGPKGTPAANGRHPEAQSLQLTHRAQSASSLS